MKRCSVKSRDLAAENAELRGALRRVHRELERVQGEHEILSEAAAGLIHAAPARDRFVFIHELRERFSIRRLCRVLVTDRRNYWLWARSQEAHDIENWIKEYNQRRLHSTLDYQTPVEVRTAWQYRLDIAA